MRRNYIKKEIQNGSYCLLPRKPEKQALFDQRVAKFHAQYVENRIRKLQCPTWQKLKLIDAIAEKIMEDVRREEEKARTQS